MNRQTPTTALLLACALLSAPSVGSAAEKPPRLVLQITIDALRGDLPRRFAHVLGDGGFRYLMDQGIDYTNAHYLHANTETIVGHASLATGTVPATHGMVGNVWFDREQGRLTYNIEDPRYHRPSCSAMPTTVPTRPISPDSAAPSRIPKLGLDPWFAVAL